VLYSVRAQGRLVLTFREARASAKLRMADDVEGFFLVAENSEYNKGINASKSGTQQCLNRAEGYYTAGGNC
jgi:hypothetical protein